MAIQFCACAATSTWWGSGGEQDVGSVKQAAHTLFIADSVHGICNQAAHI